MKLSVKKGFKHGDREFEPGKVVKIPDELPESAAKDAAKKGFGEIIEGISEDKEPEIEEIEPTEPEGESKWARMKRKAQEETPTPPHWTPEVEDWLEGRVISTGTGRNSRFAEVEVAEHSVKAKEKVGVDDEGKNKYESCTVQPGNPILFWESTTLKDLFDQLKAGMDLAVQFTGTKETSRGGNPAKLYNYSFEGGE